VNQVHHSGGWVRWGQCTENRFVCKFFLRAVPRHRNPRPHPISIAKRLDFRAVTVQMEQAKRTVVVYRAASHQVVVLADKHKTIAGL
jgi:hypothetical protein